MLYRQPEDDDYCEAHSVNFGGELKLPDPFEVVIDTGELV